MNTLSILQVSTYDTIGGAEKVAWNLFQTYRRRGLRSWLAVGHKLGSDPNVLQLPNQQLRGPWARFWFRLMDRHSSQEAQPGGAALSGRLARLLAEPGRSLDQFRGLEDYRFPATWKLLELAGQRTDILHCHNLHGGYFDLRALPWLSRQAPLILTLHDAWMLSGHCAHSFSCERWKTGCGHCPDLSIDPAVARDATAYNWQRKKEIYQQSRIYLSTPSRWLLKKVEQSVLASAVVDARVIPNGVDRSEFHPGDRQAARDVLGISPSEKVILFTANNIRLNRWKDYGTFRSAIDLLANRYQRQEKVLFLALGEDAPPEQIGQAELRFIAYQKDPAAVARYYQAADVYVHAALADTFPNTILEALACGIPVVATAVGGIPEQIDEGQTGFLVPVGDAEALADRLMILLSDGLLRQEMSSRAADTARARFDLNRQADAYISWYSALVQCGEPVLSFQEI